MTLPDHVDGSNAGQLRDELLAVISCGATALIADMTATTSCDHAGADAIVHAFQQAVVSGTELLLVVTDQAVRHVLGLNGVDGPVLIYPSLSAFMATSAAAAGKLAPALHRDETGVSRAVSRGLISCEELLDIVVTRLFRVGLSLQAAEGLPADAVRQQIDLALQQLDDTIRVVRGMGIHRAGEGAACMSPMASGCQITPDLEGILGPGAAARGRSATGSW
jgi:anti-anti-sigma regulatory factor